MLHCNYIKYIIVCALHIVHFIRPFVLENDKLINFYHKATILKRTVPESIAGEHSIFMDRTWSCETRVKHETSDCEQWGEQAEKASQTEKNTSDYVHVVPNVMWTRNILGRLETHPHKKRESFLCAFKLIATMLSPNSLRLCIICFNVRVRDVALGQNSRCSSRKE